MKSKENSYPPKHHQELNKSRLISVINNYPLASLISIDQNKPVVTHLPLIYKNNKLIGHIDKFNPQTKLLKDKQPVTVLFSGPDCYISPSIYTTTQLPTYNYIKIHIEGNVELISSEAELKASLIELTDFLEAPKHNYQLDAKNPKMAAYISYIVGFEINITAWEGKFKLSQDKNETDFENAKNELIRANSVSIEPFLTTLL